MPETYQIDWPMPGRLAVMPRPLGGAALPVELSALRDAGFDILVSALTAHDQEELHLNDEAALAASAGLSFVAFPIRDFGVPDRDALVDLARSIGYHLRRGRSVVVHCMGGVGRSGLIASAVLIDLGASAEEAIEAVSRSRGRRVPETRAQRKLLEQIAC
jgi:protein-tyrosine phosphatase